MRLFLALTFLWAFSFSQNITNSKNLNSIETDVFGNIYTVSRKKSYEFINGILDSYIKSNYNISNK